MARRTKNWILMGFRLKAAASPKEKAPLDCDFLLCLLYFFFSRPSNVQYMSHFVA